MKIILAGLCLSLITVFGPAYAQSIPFQPEPAGPTNQDISPFLQFLENPRPEVLQPSRDELVTDPNISNEQPPPRRKRSKPVVKKKPEEITVDDFDTEDDEDLPFHEELLDSTHDMVSDNIVNLSNRIDSFLGDKRADDELNRSSMRLSYSHRLRDNSVSREQTEIRFNLRLPTIDKRLKELSFLDPPTKKETEKARLKKLRQREPWRFRTDVGISLSIPIPNAFTRARLRKNWIFYKYVTRFAEEGGWYTDRGWIENTQFNIDRVIKKDEKLFRFVNEKDWRITQKRLVTSHGPSIIHNTSDDDVWSYNARIGSTKDGASYFMSNYGISIAYRRNLQGQWLYGEITPALDWPKAEGFRRTPGITFKIETLFGRR